MVMLSVSHGQSRTTSAASTSPRAIARFSSARASRTMLARSSALMCCGASVEAMVFAGAVEAASTGTPPFKESIYWGVLGVRADHCRATPTGQNSRLPKSPVRAVSARRPSYVFEVPGVKPAAPHWRPTHSLRATISAHRPACPILDKPETPPAGGCQELVTRRLGAGEVREVRDHPG